MATLSQVRERIQELRSNVIEIAGESMLENKEQIIGLLVHQQYNENVDSKGQGLRQYRPSYAHEKGAWTGRGDKTDLNLTGEYQQGLNLTVTGEMYIFDSPATTDKGELKGSWLNNWNKKVGGATVDDLTEDNKKEVWRIIEPTFVEKLQERI